VEDIAFDARKMSVYSSSDHSLLDKLYSYIDLDSKTSLKSKQQTGLGQELKK